MRDRGAEGEKSKKYQPISIGNSLYSKESIGEDRKMKENRWEMSDGKNGKISLGRSRGQDKQKVRLKECGIDIIK